MTRPILFCVTTIAILLAIPGGAAADSDASRILRVGTKEVPPFASRGPSGNWTGISVELWQAFATRAGVPFEMVEMELPEILSGLEDGSLDAGVAALTITAERESLFDFSHPFVVSGLAIAVPPDTGINLQPIVDRIVEGEFLKRFLFGLLALALASVVVWALERRANPEQFGGGFVRGIGSALWWSAVTMTTVGYGDMAPRTLLGRLLAVIWMIAGLILISALTAAITSALTVSQLSASVQTLEDLGDRPVATIAGSTGEDYLREHGIRIVTKDSLPECMRALREGGAAAVLYDEPLLRHYSLSHPDEALHILPETLEGAGYGIGLPPGSPLRESLNQFLLHHVTTPAWNSVVRRHLGR